MQPASGEIHDQVRISEGRVGLVDVVVDRMATALFDPPEEEVGKRHNAVPDNVG